MPSEQGFCPVIDETCLGVVVGAQSPPKPIQSEIGGNQSKWRSQAGNASVMTYDNCHKPALPPCDHAPQSPILARRMGLWLVAHG